MGQPWQTPTLAAVIDKCYKMIEWQPEYLLEHDGGPFALKADIFVARLYGFDDELITEWRIPRAEAVLLTPIRERLTAMAPMDGPMPTMRTAEFLLQSNYATAQIAGEYVTPLVPWQPNVTVACLRYRRRVSR